jgi:hypothetical protein
MRARDMAIRNAFLTSSISVIVLDPSRLRYGVALMGDSGEEPGPAG